MKRNVLIAIAVLFVLFICQWITLSPPFHWLFGWLIRPFIGILISIVVVFSIIVIGGLIESNGSCTIMMGSLIAIIICIVAIFPVQNSYGTSLNDYFEPENIGSRIPKIASQRFEPYDIAKETLRNEHKGGSETIIGDMDPAIVNGKFVWIAPDVPNGTASRYVNNTVGIYVETDDQQVQFTPQKFKCGEDGNWTNGLAWQLFAKK